MALVAWPAPVGAAPAGASTEPERAASAPRTEPADATARAASAKPRPRWKPYRFAEPRPEVVRKARSTLLGGRILTWTGVGVGGLGFAALIAGAVLVGTRQDNATRTTIGIINLITGAVLVAAGATLVGLGAWRTEAAERMLLEDKTRNLAASPPSRRPRGADLVLPRTRTVLSWSLRF